MPKLKSKIDECSKCHSKMTEIRSTKTMNGNAMVFYKCPGCDHHYKRTRKAIHTQHMGLSALGDILRLQFGIYKQKLAALLQTKNETPKKRKVQNKKVSKPGLRSNSPARYPATEMQRQTVPAVSQTQLSISDDRPSETIEILTA